MKNIFENAYFSKPYKTRDGRKAIYNGRSIDRYWLIVERHPWNIIGFNSCGRHSGLEEDIDIISEWEEPINEEELDNMATLYRNEVVKSCNYNKDELCFLDIDKAYIAGYRKAKEQ